MVYFSETWRSVEYRLREYDIGENDRNSLFIIFVFYHIILENYQRGGELVTYVSACNSVGEVPVLVVTANIAYRWGEGSV